jgi:hypothetical protein
MRALLRDKSLAMGTLPSLGASRGKGPYRSFPPGPGFPLLYFRAGKPAPKYTASIPCAFPAGAFFSLYADGKPAVCLSKPVSPEKAGSPGKT